MAKIYPKKDRTIEQYKRVGARARLCKAAAGKAAIALGSILPSGEYVKVRRLLDLIDEICCMADGRLFHDHPEAAGKDYTRVFYGPLGGDTSSPTDEEVRKLAREYADELFA